MSDQHRGYVSREFTVWCGSCWNWEQQTAKNMTRAIAEFQKPVASSEPGESRLGWKRDRKLGWICPNCQDKAKRESEVSS